jgi:hypothetical protein
VFFAKNFVNFVVNFDPIYGVELGNRALKGKLTLSDSLPPLRAILFLAKAQRRKDCKGFMKIVYIPLYIREP